MFDRVAKLRRATTRVLSVLFFLLTMWQPDSYATATGIFSNQGHYHPPRLYHKRATIASSPSSSMWRGHSTTPVVACMSHCTGGGAAAVAWPLWPGRRRGSAHHHGGRPILWALLSATGIVVVTSTKSAVTQLLLASDGEEGETKEGAEATDKAGTDKTGTDKVGALMISFIKAYKKELSPLIPPACRFLPTCSVYGVEAIEKFGPTKGAILTAWRLMRCNPFAGYGIDQPQWPPPGWFAGEKW